MNTPARFEGSENYVATHDLKLAVNAALTLQRPLLIKGEPGTGKTMLAEEVAAAVLYLCSDSAAFVTGVALPVDGGITL